MLETLQDIVLKRPFNNASKFHRAFRKPIDPKLGGNCFELGEELIRILLEKGEVDEAHLMDIEGEKVHGGVLARKGQRLFYLDPGYMQLEPVCVTDLEVRQKITVDCLPNIDGRHSELTVFRLTPNRIEVKRDVNSKPLACSLVQSFDLNETRKYRTPFDAYGVQEEVDHLLFRFPMGDAEVRVRRDTYDGRQDCLVVNNEGKGTILPMSGGFNLRIDQLLATIEKHFDLSRKDLFNHLQEGVQFYREIHAL